MILALFDEAKEFRRNNPGPAPWELEFEEEMRKAEQRKRELLGEFLPVIGALGEVVGQSLQSLSSSDRGSGSGVGMEQEALSYLDKNPYEKYKDYQDVAKQREMTGRPSADPRYVDDGTANAGAAVGGGSMSWADCEYKYCPMCADAIDLLGVSANEECNSCKEKYWAQIQACVQGGAASGNEDGFWKKMETYPRATEFDEGLKEYYAARKYQPELDNYHYVIGKNERGGLQGFQIIHGPDTFMGCRRWLIEQGHWSGEYWKQP
jgi:hypothetical protein